jgi:hypothetical protein
MSGSQRTSTASYPRVSATIACKNALAAINFIRTSDPFLLAALTDSLEFRTGYKLAVNTSIMTGVARILICIFNEGAFIVPGCEACFAASKLGVAIAQLV